MSLYDRFDGRPLGPFIESHRLLLLKAPVDQRKACLTPARFREARLERDPNEHAQVMLPDGCRWRVISRRREHFLTDPHGRHPLLCLLVDAGSGKTIATRQAQFLRATKRRGHLALGFSFSQLPVDASEYLDRGPDSLLIQEFRKTLTDPDLDWRILRRLILDKIRRGEFTLLGDAIDQRIEQKSPIKIATALRDFLTTYRAANCVVSGRPKAISDCWPVLFQGAIDNPDETRRRSQENPRAFEFVQIDSFTSEEAERYVGEERWRKVRSVGADFLSLPRMLEVVRRLKPQQLEGVRSEADLYWPAVEHSLDQMFIEQDASLDRDDAERLLSLLAIEMVQVEEDPIEGVDGAAAFKRFTREVFRRRKAQKDIQGESALGEYEVLSDFRRAVLHIAALNEGLECAVMEDAGEKQLYFRDMTLRDFFAALWCSRYATPEDLVWLREHQHLRGVSVEHYREEERHPSWRLLSGMPVAASNPVAWVHSVSTLFITPPGRTVVRSTEMMHTAWPRLLEIAAYEDAPRVTGEALDRWLQGDVFARVESGALTFDRAASLPSRAAEAAQHVCDQYLSEFSSLVLGRYGTASQQYIARDLDKGFGDTIAPGWFAMGDGPVGEGVIDQPYLLSRTPVTNEQMRLFDPEREDPRRFNDYATYSSEDRCPAVYMNWYDAWAAALWFHAALPSEQHWECACRGPEGRHEYWKHGWFESEQEAELGRRAWCVMSEDSSGWMGATIAVDASWKGSATVSKRAPYGLLHLIGNVWEWTSSAYANDRRRASSDATYEVSSRVLRGGAFFHVFAGDYRAANRFGNHPSVCGPGYGMRLLRSG